MACARKDAAIGRGGHIRMSIGKATATDGLSEGAKGLRLISPTLIYCVLLTAVPLATVVMFSFLTDQASDTGNKIVAGPLTFANYIEVWTGRVYQIIMARSLMVSMAVTLATVLLAYPIAYYVSFCVPAKRKAIWLFLITIPFWTSYVVRVFLWQVILGYKGVLSSTLEIIGITGEPMSFMTNAPVALTITLAHAYAPFAILPIFVALEKIDRSLLEAGQDLGESKFRTFLRVTLPLSMTGVVAAVLIVFIPTVGDYVTPNLIGDGKYPLIATWIEKILLKQGDKALGSAIAVSAMVIVAAVSLIFVMMNGKYLKGNAR
jgi:spermidine/putrescine transport system permease protein